MMVREALAADIPALVRLRMALFGELGELDNPHASDALWQATQSYFSAAQADGSARSWLVEVDGEAVACGTLALFVRPPYPGNLAGREAYLLNMYTVPAWRKRGMASALLDAMAAHARGQRLGQAVATHQRAGESALRATRFCFQSGLPGVVSRPLN